MKILIQTPHLTAPSNGAIRFTGPFQASEYKRIGKYKLTQSHSHWELSDTDTFENVLLSEKTYRVTRAWKPDLKPFSGMRLYVRVKYFGINNVESKWSEPVVFTVI